VAAKWGLGSTEGLLMATQMKLSFMPQLQADRVLRELKRAEPLSVRRAGGYRAFASGYGLAALGGGAEM